MDEETKLFILKVDNYLGSYSFDEIVKILKADDIFKLVLDSDRIEEYLIRTNTSLCQDYSDCILDILKELPDEVLQGL